MYRAPANRPPHVPRRPSYDSTVLDVLASTPGRVKRNKGFMMHTFAAPATFCTNGEQQARPRPIPFGPREQKQGNEQVAWGEETTRHGITVSSRGRRTLGRVAAKWQRAASQIVQAAHQPPSPSRVIPWTDGKEGGHERTQVADEPGRAWIDGREGRDAGLEDGSCRRPISREAGTARRPLAPSQNGTLLRYSYY
ncbi:hypothetical protein VFPBJ_02122 [Purpureocillium lilacinum]|uniref:Uncharacterized protein n=1 Tax=Purpureocillium lilacinum TaxID=33203 RepID=A0A179HES9_PURLI|nr:hypothetical protein VFPBJ_02122 [Purpureocillium lilacinum]